MRISDWSSDVCSSDLNVRSWPFSAGPMRDAAHDPAVTSLAALGYPPPAPPWKGGAEKGCGGSAAGSEEHTSELQSLMRISYAVFCLKKKKNKKQIISKNVYLTTKKHIVVIND